MLKKKNALRLIGLFLILTLSLKVYTAFFSLSFKQFDVLMGKGTHFWRHLSEKDEQELSSFRSLYLKNYPLSSKKVSSSRIPKRVHYIWLGPKEFPKESIPFVMSWISEHPSWDFVLWTDDMSRPSIHPKMVMRDITELSDLPLYSYVDRTDNYGERSDLLRYEILFKEGGVYVDHDIECFHSLDGLIRGLDFFAGLEPPHQNSGIETKIIPCNALIGARKGHPILKSTIDKVQSRWDDIEKTFTSIDAQTKALKVFHRTFHSFTLGVKECIALGANQDILFPASFFYSEAFEDKNEVARWKKKGLIFGLHHCAGEWMAYDEKSFLVSELHKEKGRRHLLEKRYNTLKKLCYGSIALSSLLAGAFFYQRRKRVYG